ncbi:MAG: GAF domain-containing protein [Chloroflexi bacterium]|nr:MAG: GAF domain-containing protein [Chloroflexota bacterium]
MSWLTDSDTAVSDSGLNATQERDLRVSLLRLYVIFVGSVLVAVLVFAALVRNRLESEAIERDLALAEAIGGKVAEALAVSGDEESVDLSPVAESLVLVTVDGETAVIIANASRRVVLSQATTVPDAVWENWQARVVRQAFQPNASSFFTTDPDGQAWEHVVAIVPGADWRVIVERPISAVLSAAQGFFRGVIIAIIIYLVGGFFFWTILSREIISPLEWLEEFSGLMRWRGHIRPDERVRFAQLTRRSDQVGSLARSLLAMGEDIEKRFVELSTLLETSRIVASSLDATRVIDNILDQVERLFHVDRVAVVALDQRAGVFRIQASRGLSEDYVSQLRIAPSEPNSPSMRALRNQIPVQVSDTETDLAFADFRPRARQEGYRSVLAIPLFTQHAPPAVLLLYKSHPYRYSYRELELASSFGHHASIAMENAALFAQSDERLQEQTQRLEAIVESLQDGLILESQSGGVLYCNRQAAMLVGVPLSEAQQMPVVEWLKRLAETAVSPEDLAEQIPAILQKRGPHFLDLTRRRADGRLQDLRLQFFDVTDAHGHRIGRGQLWHDITHDRELDRMKSALLSTVSHELRTPLAAIKGYVSTLLAQDVNWDAQTQREFLQTISEETDRLTQLVRNLLDMSRIEAGMLQIRRELYPLADILTRAASQTETVLGGRLQMELPKELPMVWVDVPRLETVVRNLLDNAAKYSPPDSPIILRTWVEDGQVLIQVRDFGSGVPEEVGNKIFDRFYRVDNGMTRQVGGVGLGLAICKGFVEAHGGRIWVENGRPGAIFTFSLPLNTDSSEESIHVRHSQENFGR